MFTLDRVLELFDEINRVPRCSGNCKPMQDYLIDFAKKNKLKYYADEYLNVVIFKDASKGMDKAPSLILQGHTDMVCVKDEGYDHDFSKDPIISYVEEGFLRAKSTTLGADNGIGAAIMLAFLESDMSLPKLECVFTSDEETNMVGAKNLDKSILTSKYMINLDEEDEDAITISSAGITDIRLNYNFADIKDPYSKENKKVYKLTIDGLKGGHSGVDINKKRLSALCLLVDFLDVVPDIEVLSLSGGSHMNAIPKDSAIVFSLDKEDHLLDVREYIARKKEIALDFDEILHIDLSLYEYDGNLKYKSDFIDNLIELFRLLPNGPLAFDKEVSDFVETSANIGRFLEEEYFSIWVSVRSSVDLMLKNVSLGVKALGKEYGAKPLSSFFEYGWPKKRDSKLAPFLVKIKKERKETIPRVSGIHAGLECGIFSRAIDGLDICALGPNIYNPHTTGERISLGSLEKFISYLQEVISRFNEI